MTSNTTTIGESAFSGTHGDSDDDLDLADELAAIDAATTGDGTVEGEIWSVESAGSDTIKLTARLPDGSKPTREFEKPVPVSEAFPLIRLLREHGYSPGAYKRLEGDRIELRATNEPGETPREDDWEFVIPKKERDFLGAATAIVYSFFSWPVFFFMTLSTWALSFVLTAFGLILAWEMDIDLFGAVGLSIMCLVWAVIIFLPFVLSNIDKNIGGNIEEKIFKI